MKTVTSFIMTLFLLTAVVIFILPPKFLLKSGSDLEIDTQEYVDCDDQKIGVILKGSSENNPVLLILGGGPEIPEYLLEERYPTELSTLFTVCYVDYRGFGLSYVKGLTEKDFTIEQQVADYLKVTDWLRSRFHNDKIYLMGHSYGTSVGLKLAHDHPERYEAFIAMSQVTDQLRSEQDTLNMTSGLSTIVFPSLHLSEYSQAQRINIWKAKIMYGGYTTSGFNAFEEVRELEIPYYLFAGVFDPLSEYDQQKEYFNTLECENKHFYKFNSSAQSPVYEEWDKAEQILKEIIT